MKSIPKFSGNLQELYQTRNRSDSSQGPGSPGRSSFKQPRQQTLQGSVMSRGRHRISSFYSDSPPSFDCNIEFKGDSVLYETAITEKRPKHKSRFKNLFKGMIPDEKLDPDYRQRQGSGHYEAEPQ